MTLTPIVTPLPVFGPINPVTPFTYRDNDTFQTQLRGLRAKVNEFIAQLELVDVSMRADLGAQVEDLVNSLNLQLGIMNDTLDEVYSMSPVVLDGRVDATEAGIVSLTSDLVDGLATLLNNIGAIDDRVVVTETNIGTVDDRVTITETDISALSASTVNVRDYGLLDGATNAVTTFNAAIAAAGVGGTIIVSKGSYSMARALFATSGITLLDYQTLKAETTYTGRNSVPDVELYFPGLTLSQAGITLGAGCTIQGITIRGPGSTIGSCVGVIGGVTSVTFDRVKILNWNTGVLLTGAYYAVFTRCEWQTCITGLKTVACYNVNLTTPRFAMQNETNTAWGVCINTGTVRALNIFGGSLENYGVNGGIVISGSLSQVNLWGVYWESSCVNSVGIASSMSGCAVNLNANIVYLTNALRWVSMSAATSLLIRSTGNKLVCSAASSTTPIVYVLPIAAGCRGEIKSDDTFEFLKAGATYDNGVANVMEYRLERPTDTLAYMGRSVVVPTSQWVKTGSNTTPSRPSAVTAGVGAMFYDVTLSEPIWSDGSVWKDSAGVTV